MKVELHLHTSRRSSCAACSVPDAMRRLIQCGYEAVYVTEHDAVWPDWELENLRERFGEIRIFPGVELTITRQPLQHLLVLGTSDMEYLRLLEPADVLNKARAEGHLTILAHPFRWNGPMEGLLGTGPLPDAIEYRTPNHEPERADLALHVNEHMHLPLINAGDVHALDFINRFWIQTDRPLVQADDIRPIILAGQYENCFGDDEDV